MKKIAILPVIMFACLSVLSLNAVAQNPCDACHDQFPTGNPTYNPLPGYYVDNQSSSTFTISFYEATVDASSCTISGAPTFHSRRVFGASYCPNPEWSYDPTSYQNIVQMVIEIWSGTTLCASYTMNTSNQTTGVQTHCVSGIDWFANYSQCGTTDYCFKGLLVIEDY